LTLSVIPDGRMGLEGDAKRALVKVVVSEAYMFAATLEVERGLVVRVV